MLGGGLFAALYADNRLNVLRKFGLILILPFFLIGCMDLFGLSDKDISGDYYLKKWEDGKTFFLHDTKKEYESFPDLGPIGGIVIEMGWDKKNIIALRKAHVGGNIDGWMVVKVKEKTVSGPYTREIIESTPNLKKLVIYSAKEAWEKL